MNSKIGFEMSLIVVEAIRGRYMCEFHGSKLRCRVENGPR